MAYGKNMRLYRKVLKQFDALADLSRQAGEIARRAETVSRWSVGQHLEHLALSDAAVAAGLDKLAAAPGAVEGGPNLLGRMILLFGIIPRGKGRAWQQLLPGETIDGERLAASFDDLARRLEAVYEPHPGELEAPPGKFRHRIFGILHAFQWLRFVDIHHRHHGRIIRDIRRAHRGRLAGALLLALMMLPAALAAREELPFARIDRLSIEEGLSHNQVWCVHQDARGFLWIGTQDGLNRYDGYQIKVFKSDPEDPGSLSASRITAIHEDRQGELWIGTASGGLNRFQRADESFVHYRHQPDDPGSMSHDNVSCLLEDRAGDLWIGTDDGLTRRRREDGTFIRYQHHPADPGSLADNHVLSLHEQKSGELWIGTYQGLDLFDRSTESFVHTRHDPAEPQSPRHRIVFAVQEDGEGRLWVATARGLSRLDRRRGTFTRFSHDPADPGSLSHDRVLSLALDRNDHLWIGTASGGVNRFDPTTGTFDHRRHDPIDPQSPSSDSITCIHEDRSGILWLGSYDGVNKYVPKPFTTYRRRPAGFSLSSDHVLAIHEDRSGVLWVGTHDAGLDGLDRRERTAVRYRSDREDPASLPQGPVDAILEDRSGVLWVGAWGGLARLDRGRGRFTRFRHDPANPRSLSSNVVQALYEDRSGDLWVGTFRGLNHFDAARTRLVRYPVSPDQPESLGEATIRALLEDHSGALWVGSDGDGLYRLDRGSGGVDRFRHDPADPNSLSSDLVASLHQDRTGVLWIGTAGGGLNRLDPEPGEIVRYREKDGLASDSVLSILEDDDGRLWLATHRGLSRFDPQSQTFRNYDAEDGLQGNVFSLGAAFRSPSGEMFFGGNRGLSAFDPERVVDDPHAPSVVVTDFQLFNRSAALRRVDPASPLERSILETRELVLSHRHYVLAFEFAALHYASPEKNRYAHRLEGFDRDWIPTDASKRFAQYSNLAPGEYVFRVKGSNADGVWNEEGASIRLRVLPPPWRTWWAYAIYALAFSALVYGYVRSQKKKIASERAINARLRDVDKLKDEILGRVEEQVRERTAQVKILRGLLPICAQCKKIRDDKGYWNQLERYIDAHSEASFTHGLCPDCAHELYSGLEPAPELRYERPS